MRLSLKSPKGSEISTPPEAELSPNEQFTEKLRRFGPLGIVAIIVILGGNSLFTPLSALLVLLWARLSRTPWREIGYARPPNWLLTLVVGIAFGIAFKLIMKTMVMPLLGAPPINQAFHYLVGNRSALPEILYIVLFGAAFGEETIFRGYAFERLGKLFGRTTRVTIASVLFTAAWFGIEHYSLQGLPGVEQAAIVGLVFGTIYAITGRIWLLIFAHAAFDLTAVAIIYWDYEATVAHLIFK